MPPPLFLRPLLPSVVLHLDHQELHHELHNIDHEHEHQTLAIDLDYLNNDMDPSEGKLVLKLDRRV